MLRVRVRFWSTNCRFLRIISKGEIMKCVDGTCVQYVWIDCIESAQLTDSLREVGHMKFPHLAKRIFVVQHGFVAIWCSVRLCVPGLIFKIALNLKVEWKCWVTAIRRLFSPDVYWCPKMLKGWTICVTLMHLIFRFFSGRCVSHKPWH